MAKPLSELLKKINPAVVKAAQMRAEKETLYVLQNKDLMQQIAASLKTHQQNTTNPSPPLDK